MKKRGYKKLYKIGEGSMGEVYCVKEEKTGKKYACKISNQISWLKQESDFLSKIIYPLFPRWKEYWEEEQKAYLVIEYISGSSLEDLLQRRHFFSQQETVRIAIEVASGLAWLQEGSKVIVYRDIKPENIILQEDGRVRLVDMGLAMDLSDTQREQRKKLIKRAGTIAYAPPEQWEEGGIVDVRSDIYALGKVMHYMVTGCNPSQKQGNFAPIRVYNRHLWRGLEQIIIDCISPQPKERISTMRELIGRLSVYRNGSGWQIWKAEISALLRRRKRQKFYYEKSIWKYYK